MSNQWTETLVGGAVVAVAAGFLIYANQFADLGRAGAGDYTLTASFRSVEGVGVGTDVRLAGVKVGTVTGLELDPVTFRAETFFAIDGALELPDDTAAVVASEGLLGGSFIELLPGGSPILLADGDEILDTESAVSLVQLMLRFVTGGDDEG
jgi:phospholipid/cholesterol/gamma-HCH transport system substrate-binding protein